MTKKGNFSLEIVDAATEEAFKEFPGSNGVDAYVEVEPHLEYFVRIKNNHPKDRVILSIKVDGEDLDYTHSLNKGEKCQYGLWSYDQSESQSEDTALQFHKIFNSTAQRSYPCPTEDAETYAAFSSDIGTVEVSIHREIMLKGSYKMKKFTSKLAETPQIEDYEDHIGEKKVKSQPGKKQKLMHDDGMRQRSKAGKELETIKVRYCSTVGLIRHGVLPQPPPSEWNLLLAKEIGSKEVPPELHIQPTPWKYELRDDKGNIVKTVESDFFDLTTLEDSE